MKVEIDGIAYVEKASAGGIASQQIYEGFFVRITISKCLRFFSYAIHYTDGSIFKTNDGFSSINDALGRAHSFIDGYHYRKKNK